MSSPTIGAVDRQYVMEQYFMKHGIRDFLKDMMNALLQEMPAEPIEFMRRYLDKSVPRAEGDVTSTLVSPDEEDDDDEDDYEDEEEDEVGDLPSRDEEEEDEKRRRMQYARGGRRTSVSAEVTQMEALKTMKPPVHEKSDTEATRIMGVLDESILFKHLDEEQKSTIVKAMFKKTYEKGQHIIDQGEEGDNFYIVEDGECDVFVKVDGQEKSVPGCGVGDCFGELALMYNAPRAATVVAKSDAVVVWALDRVTFRMMVMDMTVNKRSRYNQLLSKVPLLAPLTKEEKGTVIDVMEEKEFDQNDAVIAQGEKGNMFYIIVEGSVSCTQKPPDSDDVKEVGKLSEGDYFGEIALLTNRPRLATVTVTSKKLKSLALERKVFTRVMGPLQDLLRRNMQLYHSYIGISI